MNIIPNVNSIQIRVVLKSNIARQVIRIQFQYRNNNKSKYCHALDRDVALHLYGNCDSGCQLGNECIHMGIHSKTCSFLPYKEISAPFSRKRVLETYLLISHDPLTNLMMSECPRHII